MRGNRRQTTRLWGYLWHAGRPNKENGNCVSWRLIPLTSCIQLRSSFRVKIKEKSRITEMALCLVKEKYKMWNLSYLVWSGSVTVLCDKHIWLGILDGSYIPPSITRMKDLGMWVDSGKKIDRKMKGSVLFYADWQIAERIWWTQSNIDCHRMVISVNQTWIRRHWTNRSIFRIAYMICGPMQSGPKVY